MVCGDEGGAVYILEVVGFEQGPTIVNAWHDPVGGDLVFGCPQCRIWSEIPQSALGSEIPCPNCGKSVKLNPFTIRGDWRPIAEAWQKSENKR